VAAAHVQDRALRGDFGSDPLQRSESPTQVDEQPDAGRLIVVQSRRAPDRRRQGTSSGLRGAASIRCVFGA